MDPDAEDHYRALGVRATDPPEDIERAWRFAVLAFHPDRFRDEGQRERAEGYTKRLNAAWEVLRDPVSRARYDRRREVESAPGRVTPGVVMRAIPCPTCATVGRAPDARGAVLDMRCKACGAEFGAIVGGRMLDRPRLDGGLWRMRYQVAIAGARGRIHVLRFRRFPDELALATGEGVTVVFKGDEGTRPRYVIRHAEGLDMGWRVD